MILVLGKVKMLILICGRSRAGKTTYAERFSEVLHLDDFGKYPKSIQPCIDKVKSIKTDLIIDGIFEAAYQREELLRAYSGSGERICIWIDTEIETIGIRMFGSKKYANKVLELMIPFEPPTYNEGWNEIYILHKNDEITLEKVGDQND